jgi:hypothetical protein
MHPRSDARFSLARAAFRVELTATLTATSNALGGIGWSPWATNVRIICSKTRSSSPSHQATVKVLSDDFDSDLDRWTTVMSGTNGSSHTVKTAAGRDRGGYRRMRHVLPGTDDGQGNPTTIRVVHLYGGGTWDPAVDGALSHIDHSEDRREFDPPFAGAAVGAFFLLEQDGKRYSVRLGENATFTNTRWKTRRFEGLTPSDFSPAPGFDFSPAPGPDFSSSGGPMTFGYLRSNANNSVAKIVITHGLDNWTVELVGE